MYIYCFFLRWLLYLAKLSPGERLSPLCARVVGEDDAAKIAASCNGAAVWPYAVPRPRPLWYRASSSSTIGFLSACLLSLSPSRFHPPPYVYISRPYVAPDLLLPLVRSRATDPVVVVVVRVVVYHSCIHVCMYVYIYIDGKETKRKRKTKTVLAGGREESELSRR